MTKSANKKRKRGKVRNHCKCGRKAMYRRPNGKFAARKDHPLCRQCYTSLRDSERAAALPTNANVCAEKARG